MAESDGSCAYNLDADDEPLARVGTQEDLLDVFENELDAFVARSSPTRLFVHAGVVGWRGRAIVVPGRSFTGKTTLVTELVRAGATYYSDEFAVFDENGLVHPYARPLGVRNGGTRQTKVTVDQLGGHAGCEPLPVGLVVTTKYRKDARWRPRPLTAGQGVLALLGETVPARLQPDRALQVLSAAVSGATILKGTRGEAAAVAAQILSTLGQD